MTPERENSPIDRILDRRLPGLTGERRELAHEGLTALADLLIRIAVRQAHEAEEADSRGSGPGGKMDASPSPT